MADLTGIMDGGSPCNANIEAGIEQVGKIWEDKWMTLSSTRCNSGHCVQVVGNPGVVALKSDSDSKKKAVYHVHAFAADTAVGTKVPFKYWTFVDEKTAMAAAAYKVAQCGGAIETAAQRKAREKEEAKLATSNA